jgi:hypothetical protein
MGSGVPDWTFGYYDKEPISWVPDNIFAQNHEQVVRHYQSRGVDVNNFSIGAQIWRQAFEITVVHTAIKQFMKRSNYSVPEKTVDRQVALLPQFHENGRFSSVLYQQLPESSRLALWRQVQDELIKMRFYNDFFYGLLMSPAEAEFIGNMTSVMRSFDMVSFSVDSFPEDEYFAYARANANHFRTIHLSRITVNTNERDARRILDSINNGTITFEDAARGQSQDSFADRGGDMGSRYTFELDFEIPNTSDRNIIFGLRRGEISNIVRIGDSWVFFRVEDELKPANFEDFSTMERVRSYLRNFDRGRMEDWAIKQAEAFINEVNIHGFDDAAHWQGLEKQSFGPLPINYGGLDLFSSLESFGLSGVDTQSMSRNENFWRIAFSTQVDTPSVPFVQGGNVLVLLPVEQIYAEESTIENISMLYSMYWVNMITEQSLPHYFLTNPRMEDRFWETYFRLFM